jgi:hypothetical protein
MTPQISLFMEMTGFSQVQFYAFFKPIPAVLHHPESLTKFHGVNAD